MNNSKLQHAWEQQKMNFQDQLISEEEILFAILPDYDKQQTVRRLLYNASSFVFLLVFCQTC